MPIKPKFATLRFSLSFGVASVPIVTRLVASCLLHDGVGAFASQDFLFFALTLLICSANEILDDNTAERQIYSAYLTMLMLITLICGLLLGFTYLPEKIVHQKLLLIFSFFLSGIVFYVSLFPYFWLKTLISEEHNNELG